MYIVDIQHIQRYTTYSGLRLNVSKPLLVYIGPWKIKPVLPFEIQTTSDTFNVLGIELGNNDKLCNDKNILEKIKKKTVAYAEYVESKKPDYNRQNTYC